MRKDLLASIKLEDRIQDEYVISAETAGPESILLRAYNILLVNCCRKLLS